MVCGMAMVRNELGIASGGWLSCNSGKQYHMHNNEHTNENTYMLGINLRNLVVSVFSK